MEKNIFIFDQNKCVECHACIVACINENGFQSPDPWRNIYRSNEDHFPTLPLLYLSLACNHCDEAPCLKNCPSLAYSRDEKTGAVIHHSDKCIGCKYCTWACPYDAPKYNPKNGIIEKCTFCNHRIQENLKPACADLCPVGALDFAFTNLTKEESLKSNSISVDLGPHIKVLGLRRKSAPELDLSLFNAQTQTVHHKKFKKISAVKEWPLLIFTLLTAALVGTYLSRITNQFSFFQKHIYIGFVIFAAILSILHLGKKQRVWRSIINIRNSWLSREIVLFTLFFAFIFCDFYLFKIPYVLILFMGLALLLSIDMIYRLATWKWPIRIHSAQTILIAASIYFLLSQYSVALITILTLRLILYIYRMYKYKMLANLIPYIRITTILFNCLSILLSFHFYLVLIPFTIGEFIDRMDFYNELNIADPKNDFLH